MTVSIVLGSASDEPVLKRITTVLDELEVPYKVTVASAHRTPDRVRTLAGDENVDVFIAVAGLSAALPGVVAAHTNKPVIGVPVSGKVNLDSILSIVQMPKGVPVAAVGLDRGDNAAILAAEMIALKDDSLAERLIKKREDMAQDVLKQSESVQG